MINPHPQAQHQWLQRLVGEWTSECECQTGPGQPPQVHRGTDSVRMLGGLWAVCDGTGEMPGGGTGYTIMTLGYDPVRGRFVGTFVGSMMTHLWLYDGQLTGNVLTLDAEGPSFTDPGKMAKYQDVIEIVSDDHRTLTSQVLGEDGGWTRFMTAHYRRTK